MILRTVLVVDDEWAIAEVLEDILSDEGFRVVVTIRRPVVAVCPQRHTCTRIFDCDPILIRAVNDEISGGDWIPEIVQSNGRGHDICIAGCFI